MELDARRLRVLHTVAVRGGVTAAADTLCVSPSAVSQQLSLLEREAGCDLVERVGRGVALTPAGRALASAAEEVLHALDRAEAALAAARKGIGGTVRVSAFPSAARALVAPAVARTLRRHPDLDVRVGEGEDGQGLADLRLAAVDVVIAQEYDHVPVDFPTGLVRHALIRDPLHLCVPASGPLAGASSLEDLRDARWMAAAPGTPCGDSTRQACHDAGFSPDVRHSVMDFALALDLVAEGLGVALIPGLGLRDLPEGVVTAPTAHARTIYALTREPGVGPVRPAVAAFLGELLGRQPSAARGSAGRARAENEA
ncbi:DNA-binding transcriptional LysR family regulator [Actinocorallia herbida]|uniref:DNA-binding transcriptional LysR family regulator n=1 Tax=Actinocorallia herbida TaxID=58109 RepID=A0A3N1D6R9_9ACTN|nr:LysR family transcriptional regulator [Actinocorallia herbida]ROO89159.1 DNA-binding transcriptional LysR family regulator [Actinocorallia herbida]